MLETTDVVLVGTGEFASRLLFDIAATAQDAVSVTVIGRDAGRLAWLRTAANARAVLFGKPAQFHTVQCGTFDEAALAPVLQALAPRVVIQAASLQTASVLRSSEGAWNRLVADGGLSVTAVFQTMLTLRVGRALQQVGSQARLINACFPDVTNGLLTAAGVPVLCGVGNVAILGTAFAGALNVREPGRLKILAHYQQLARWRKLPAERTGSVPRAWLDDVEVQDVSATFQDVMLSPQTAFDISGATGVPLALALATGKPWRGHVPAPRGLPGGYPVSVDAAGELALDLPATLTEREAVAWNARFEADNGLVVDENGQVTYTGTLYDELRRQDPGMAEGFHIADIEQVLARMTALRDRLSA